MTTTETTPSERTGQSPINRDFPDQQAWFKCCKDCAFRRSENPHRHGVSRIADPLNYSDSDTNAENYVFNNYDKPFTCVHRVGFNNGSKIVFLICAGYAAFYNRIFR